MWQVAKVWGWKKPLTDEEKAKDKRRSLSEILETTVIACSDQQVFTGAAYALTLRYWKGCTISAYHYNLIANMMLLTCATHLMSVTIVRNYWKYPWLAVFRVICISGVFIVTGVLFTNQNAREDPPFPTALPLANETDSLIFLPAACFQSQQNTATDTFQATTANSTAFWNTLKLSKPGNMIQGWNWYVVILLFYGAAIIAECIRFCRRGRSRPGWRSALARHLGRCFGRGTFPRRVIQNVFLFYLAAGVGISVAATVVASQYIFGLRRWADRSGWIETDKGQNPENDFSSFGQLVPIWTSVMIIFSFAGIVSEKITRRNNRKHAGEERPPQDGTIAYLDPSHYDLFSPQPDKPEKPGEGSGSYFSAHPNSHGLPTPMLGSTLDLEAGGSFERPPRIHTPGASSVSSSSGGAAGLAITTPGPSPSSPRPEKMGSAASSAATAAAVRPGGGNGGASGASSSSQPEAASSASAPEGRPGAGAGSRTSSQTRPPAGTSTPPLPQQQQQPSDQRPKPPSKNSASRLP
ncbi:hypothetical protein SLS62_008982 [Diatrype stigma]|uniref:Uncharacterized protein n=1 Tax=Diatrype stigma TaxID=117547 RepID=A0AAN9UGZ7_9PEZI